MESRLKWLKQRLTHGNHGDRRRHKNPGLIMLNLLTRTKFALKGAYSPRVVQLVSARKLVVIVKQTLFKRRAEPAAEHGMPIFIGQPCFLRRNFIKKRKRLAHSRIRLKLRCSQTCYDIKPAYVHAAILLQEPKLNKTVTNALFDQYDRLLQNQRIVLSTNLYTKFVKAPRQCQPSDLSR